MFSPQLCGHRLQLDGFLHHGIVPVPLHEIGSAHERAMLAGSPVVVPQIEIHKIDGVGEWRPREHAILPQTIDDRPAQ